MLLFFCTQASTQNIVNKHTSYQLPVSEAVLRAARPCLETSGRAARPCVFQVWHTHLVARHQQILRNVLATDYLHNMRSCICVYICACVHLCECSFLIHELPIFEIDNRTSLHVCRQAKEMRKLFCMLTMTSVFWDKQGKLCHRMRIVIETFVCQSGWKVSFPVLQLTGHGDNMWTACVVPCLTLKNLIYTTSSKNCIHVDMDDARAAPTYPMPVHSSGPISCTMIQDRMHAASAAMLCLKDQWQQAQSASACMHDNTTAVWKSRGDGNMLNMGGTCHNHVRTLLQSGHQGGCKHDKHACNLL